MPRNRSTQNVITMPSALPPRLVDAEAIARRAYELYEQRGRTDGSDLEDWLRAEAELLRPSQQTKAS